MISLSSFSFSNFRGTKLPLHVVMAAHSAPFLGRPCRQPRSPWGNRDYVFSYHMDVSFDNPWDQIRYSRDIGVTPYLMWACGGCVDLRVFTQVLDHNTWANSRLFATVKMWFWGEGGATGWQLFPKLFLQTIFSSFTWKVWAATAPLSPYCPPLSTLVFILHIKTRKPYSPSIWNGIIHTQYWWLPSCEHFFLNCNTRRKENDIVDSLTLYVHMTLGLIPMCTYRGIFDQKWHCH